MPSGTERNANTSGHSDTDADADPNADRNSDANADADANTYGISNPNPTLRAGTRRDGELVATGRQCYGYFRPEQRDAAGRSCVCARESRPGYECQRD
jgi:hypothetical protein